MAQNHKQRTAFVTFLRQGLNNGLIPGGLTFEQVLRMFDLPQNIPTPEFGITCAWFQDLQFFFDDNGILFCFQLPLKSFNAEQNLPKALNLEWGNFAAELTPETFEELVTAELIPCMKATMIMDEQIYPAIYCLDHLGIMPRFADNAPHKLEYIMVRLIRNFPMLDYESIWPPTESHFHLLSPR